MSAPDPSTGFTWEGRAIGLLDLDAFFASVEVLDHPEWRGLPLIVGGSPEERGVVSTASYEARPFGVHSGMSSAAASRLCPQAIWCRGNRRRYREVSDQVMALISRETPYMERLSIDEAVFDITPGRFSRQDPVEICRRIQGSVDALGITCSIGLSTSRTTSKIASDREKPHGLTVVPPGTEALFLADLPLRALPGVGRATEERLHRAGIHRLGELGATPEDEVARLLGQVGPSLVRRARGVDPRPVRALGEGDPVKSVSSEHTFTRDLTDTDEVHAALWSIAETCGRRCRAKGLEGSVVTLKLKYSYERGHSAQMHLGEATADEAVLWPHLLELLDRIWSPGVPVRLMGVGLSHFEEEPRQATLFDEAGDEGDPKAPQGRPSATGALDSIRERFGEGAVRMGRTLRGPEGA